MPYTKTTWQKRIVEHPNRYLINGTTQQTIEPDPGDVTQAGTALTEDRLNNLETQYDQAIADAPGVVAAAKEVGDLKTPTKALAMGNKRITGLGVPSAAGDALRKGTRLTETEMPRGTAGYVLTGNGAGSNPTFQPVVTGAGAVASDNLRNSNDTMRTLTPGTTTYTKLKEIKINAPLRGVRIKFDLWYGAGSGSGTYGANGRIYINSSAVGTAHSHGSSGSWLTFSDDITDLDTNDLIQLYVRVGSVDGDPNQASVKNLRLYYDLGIYQISGLELVVPILTLGDPTISVTNQDPT